MENSPQLQVDSGPDSRGRLSSVNRGRLSSIQSGAAALHAAEGGGPRPWGWPDFALMFAVAVLLAVPGGLRLSGHQMETHEAFVSVTARHMVESGDWVLPQFNGEPRLTKTPLAYWAAALTALAAGGSGRPDFGVTDLTARLPSLLAAIATAALVFLFARQLFGRLAATLAAGAWVTSLAAVRFGGNARAECLMTFFIVLCFASFWSALNAPTGRRQTFWFALFGLSLGLANMAKEAAPVAFLGVSLAAFLVWSGRWRQVFKPGPLKGLGLGLLLMAAVILPWWLMAVRRCPHYFEVIRQQLWAHGAGDDTVRNNQGFLYYFYTLPLLIMPWVLLLPGALALPFARPMRPRREPLLYLWLWVVGAFVVVTVIPVKRPHYLLPAIPGAAILLGLVAEDLFVAHRWFSRRMGRAILLSYALGASLAGVGFLACGWGANRWSIAGRQMGRWFQQVHPAIWWFGGIALVIGGAGCGIAWVLMRRALSDTGDGQETGIRPGRPAAALAVLLAAVTAAGAVAGGAEGLWSDSNMRQFAEAVNVLVPRQVPVHQWGPLELGALHYLSRDMPLISGRPQDTTRAISLAHAPGPVVFVVHPDRLSRLPADGSLTPICRLLGPEPNGTGYLAPASVGPPPTKAASGQKKSTPPKGGTPVLQIWANAAGAQAVRDHLVRRGIIPATATAPDESPTKQ